jgi:hypothetical protein
MMETVLAEPMMETGAAETAASDRGRAETAASDRG